MRGYPILTPLSKLSSKYKVKSKVLVSELTRTSAVYLPSHSELTTCRSFESEMEYCASAASMLAEEIWQIAEGFVEVPVNLLVQLKKCGKNIPND